MSIGLQSVNVWAIDGRRAAKAVNAAAKVRIAIVLCGVKLFERSYNAGDGEIEWTREAIRTSDREIYRTVSRERTGLAFEIGRDCGLLCEQR